MTRRYGVIQRHQMQMFKQKTLRRSARIIRKKTVKAINTELNLKFKEKL